MKTLERGTHILHDLALIYIALAHGADQVLSDGEMDLVASRLLETQAGVSQGTVLSAMKHALNDYMKDDAEQRIEQAVKNIRETVPHALRYRIIRDLTEIGKADDRFLFAEARFIGELIDAWRHHATGTTLRDDATWSILGQDDEGWTLVHDLGFIYVTLAHKTDGVLSREEVNAILTKLGEWMPNANADDLRIVLHDVLVAYGHPDEEGTFQRAVEAVQEHLPVHQRAAVLADLQYVAQADGVLLVEERVLIEQLIQAWTI